MQKVVDASRTRLAARQQRDTQRRKNALESSALPAKLADCRSNDVERSELFSVEGSRALALGVQWHPEWLFREHELSLALFGAFGAAVWSQYRGKDAKSA